MTQHPLVTKIQDTRDEIAEMKSGRKGVSNRDVRDRELYLLGLLDAFSAMAFDVFTDAEVDAALSDHPQ